ncbi:InlB B-repeat-containing protein [Bifidobacterium aemilianum]|uniref:InlB B-repeat-containing protein n=1 Tax=Bifidobacterium aemilianum TaxID=2493120 RepID=UPI000FDDCAF8|nr:InlB B-repeat-containing protein [Bifidobacterium aemilianum]
MPFAQEGGVTPSIVPDITIDDGEILGDYMPTGNALPTRTGHCLSWVYASNDMEWTMEYDAVSADGLVLKEHWTPNPHDVNFHHHDGSGSNTQDATVGSAYGAILESMAPAYTRTHNWLSGWSQQADGSGPWNLVADTLPDNDLDLYAQWLKQRKVTFDTDGHSPATCVEYVNPDGASMVPGPTAPSQAGAVFR